MKTIKILFLFTCISMIFLISCDKDNGSEVGIPLENCDKSSCNDKS